MEKPDGTPEYKIDTMHSTIRVFSGYEHKIQGLLSFLVEQSRKLEHKEIQLPSTLKGLKKYLTDLEATAICKFRLCLSWRATVVRNPDGRLEFSVNATQYDFVPPTGYSLQ